VSPGLGQLLRSCTCRGSVSFTPGSRWPGDCINRLLSATSGHHKAKTGSVSKEGMQSRYLPADRKLFDPKVRPDADAGNHLFASWPLSDASDTFNNVAARISFERAGSFTARARIMAPTISARAAIALRRR
jgi:hypothetical protein